MSLLVDHDAAAQNGNVNSVEAAGSLCDQEQTSKSMGLPGLIVLAGILIVFLTAHSLANRFEPYIREQAIQYLQKSKAPTR